MSARLVEEVFEVCIKYATVREVGGNNRGPQVEEWLRGVGLQPGEPWCMAYVYSIVQEAAGRIGEANPLVRTGGVAKQWRQVDNKLRTDTPKRGCIFIHIGPDGQHGHTGFVEWVNEGAPGTLSTWEGNSNAAGSRDGGGVWHGNRPLTYPLGYIDLGAA